MLNLDSNSDSKIKNMLTCNSLWIFTSEITDVYNDYIESFAPFTFVIALFILNVMTDDCTVLMP